MKLLNNYTHIVLSNYTNFCSEKTITRYNTGILLLDCYFRVILFIGVCHET